MNAHLEVIKRIQQLLLYCIQALIGHSLHHVIHIMSGSHGSTAGSHHKTAQHLELLHDSSDCGHVAV